MSIVKMKRLRLIGLNVDRDVLLHKLMLLGCIELTEIPEDSDTSALLERQESDLSAKRANLLRLNQAVDILQKYAPEKSGLFPKREEISVETLFADEVVGPALDAASAIILREEQISRQFARISQMEANRTALGMWRALDVPLDSRGTEQAGVLFGTVPASVDPAEVETALHGATEQAQLFRAGDSRELRCLMVVYHRSVEQEVITALRDTGFSQVNFSEEGTAADNIARLDGDLDTAAREIARLKAEIVELNPKRGDLKLCIDRMTQEIAKEEAKEKLAVSGSVFAMEGWMSVPEQERVEALLAEYSCAYELAEPEPEEVSENHVPVKLRGNALTEPLNMVTEMYTLPAYDGIDPNGLITPFFTVFFGIMYADLAYGLILLTLGILAKRKLKLRGMMKQMEGLLILCGVTTAVFGFLFGGFFGDAIPVVTETFGGNRIEPWSLINPLEEPMTIMIAACALGGVQIITGMIVKLYMGFRDGQGADALLDVLPWWLLFAGIGVLVLGYGPYVLIGGALVLICTQGRHSPTFGGKLMGGVASLYDITSYLSDILSYIRLMALLLATSVIAMVFNMLGTMFFTGGGSAISWIVGLVGFAIVFLIGHVFNMGINIIGTYVHAARLQYLEFYGKFYKEGGKAFSPLRIITKYHDVKNN